MRCEECGKFILVRNARFKCTNRQDVIDKGDFAVYINVCKKCHEKAKGIKYKKIGDMTLVGTPMLVDIFAKKAKELQAEIENAIENTEIDCKQCEHYDEVEDICMEHIDYVITHFIECKDYTERIKKNVI